MKKVSPKCGANGIICYNFFMAMKDLSTLHKKDLKTEATKKRKKSILKWRLFGSVLTVALTLCVIQLSWSTVYSITKIGFYINKINVSRTSQRHRK